MLIAKQTETGIEIADHKVMLPNTSFAAGGPTVSQIEELGFLQVTMWKPYDFDTEKLVSVPAYIENNQVFTVVVEQKTQEELDQDVANKDAQSKIARAEAYRVESDPLFFKAQRGEATIEEWLAKVQEIKDRYTGTPVDGVTTITGA